MTDELFEQCIRRIRQGDKEGLKQIYESYISYIYSVIYTVLQNKEDAEDVTSDFFIKLWTTIADQYQFGNKHKAYLAKIAHNMAIDFLRKNGKEQTILEFENLVDTATATTLSPIEEDPDTKVVERITIKEAIATLKESEQQVLNMKLFGELTFAEISQILNAPMGTVTWWYKTAIEKLKKSNYGKEALL